MEDLRTENDVINFLSGNWTSESGRISFRIVGTEIINITGIKDVNKIDITESRFSLKWSAQLGQWLITNMPVMGAANNPVVFGVGSFSIRHVDIWPQKEQAKFISA